MAYGLKYQLEFESIDGKECEINLYKEDYSGAVTDVNGGNVPIRIKRYGAGKSLFDEPIRGTEAVVQLYSESDEQFSDIFLNTSRKYKLEYIEDKNTIFEGFVYPEQYQEPYLHYPYLVTIRAYDALGELRNADFNPYDYYGYTVSYRQTLINIISKCLLRNGLDYQIRYIGNIAHYVDGTSNDYVNFLENTYIDYRIFRDGSGWKNCYEILTSILKSIGCVIMQNAGQFYIIRVDYLKYNTTHQYKLYTHLGAPGASSGTTNEIDITGTTGSPLCVFVGRNAVMEILPAYKRVQITHDPGRRNNILNFNNFDGNFYDDEFSGNVPNSWAYDSFYIDPFHISGSDELILLFNSNIGTTPDHAITQSIVISEAGNTNTVPGGKVKFSFKYNCGNNSTVTMYCYVYLVLNGAGYAYLDADGEWQSTFQTIPIEITKKDAAEYKTFEITSELETMFGAGEYKINVGIAQPVEGTSKPQTKLKNIKLKVYTEQWQDVDTETDNIDVLINEDFSYLNPINTDIGEENDKDTAEGYYRDVFFKNNLFNTDDVITEWKIYDGSDFVTQGHLISGVKRLEIQSRHNEPSRIIRGAIRGDLDFYRVLKDAGGNKYFPNSLEYNPKNQLWTGEWIQILRVTNALGDFNDDFNNDFLI